jgi:predicted metalloendopeptidase
MGRGRFIRRSEPIDPEKFENKDLTSAQVICTQFTMFTLQYANARFFIDALYPDRGTSIREVAGGFITSILSGFQSMIDQLPWMDAISKASAYGKISNLRQNIAFPDFILDNVQLTNYFSALDIVETDDFITMLQKIYKFNKLIEWNPLSQTGAADRTDFMGPPGSVNAWYHVSVIHA